jgi:hypothetical protein
MILAVRTALLFCLIWALASFGFAAVALTMLFGQPSYIDPNQIYGVATVSGVAAVVGLGLAAVISLRLMGRGSSAEWISPRVLVVIAVCFAGIAAWSFLADPHVDQQEHFFMRFMSGARFEFLTIAAATFVMGLRKA